MFVKLRKHTIKILVFVINVALAAIAVFVIREKDQDRLLLNAEENNLSPEESESVLIEQSFEGDLAPVEGNQPEEDPAQNTQADVNSVPANPPSASSPAPASAIEKKSSPVPKSSSGSSSKSDKKSSSSNTSSNSSSSSKKSSSGSSDAKTKTS